MTGLSQGIFGMSFSKTKVTAILRRYGYSAMLLNFASQTALSQLYEK